MSKFSNRPGSLDGPPRDDSSLAALLGAILGVITAGLIATLVAVAALWTIFWFIANLPSIS